MDNPRRKHPRIKVSLVAMEKNSEGQLGLISDICIVGCFIETQSTYPIDSVIDIKFLVPHELKNISSRARVSRLTPEGVGVEFFAMPPEYKTVLREFIRKEIGSVKISDRRKNHRVDLSISLFNENEEKIGITKNISVSGLLVDLKNTFPIGAELKLKFKLPTSDQFINVTTKVSRLDKNLTCLDFIDIKNEDAKNIEILTKQLFDDYLI